METHPQNSITQLKELYANEDYEKGYHFSKLLIVKFPNNLPIRIHHALLGSNFLSKSEGEQLWNTLKSDFPNSFYVPYKWAEKLEKENYYLACEKYNEAFLLDTTKKSSLRKAINISHEVRDWNLSKSLCKTYLTTYPKDQWVKLRLAQNEFRLNNQTTGFKLIHSIIENLDDGYNNGIVQFLLELREYELVKSKLIPHKNFAPYPILRLLVETRIKKLEDSNYLIKLLDKTIREVLYTEDKLKTARTNAMVELAKLDLNFEAQLKSVFEKENISFENYPSGLKCLYNFIVPKSILKSTRDSSQKIDLIFSWVDVDDPHFRNRLQKYLDKDLLDQKNDQKDISRYTNNNEISFSLKLIERNFKGVNNIFIVTNNQTFDLSQFSPWLQGKIQFINQEDILDSYYIDREIFNSTIIEAFLWNIPGLGENFMYLCDDYFLGNKFTLKKDIFDHHGRLRTNLLSTDTSRWSKVTHINKITPPEWVHTVSYLNNARNEYIKITGEEPNLKFNHQPLLFNKTSFKNAFDLFAKEWKNNFFNDTIRTNNTVATICLFSWLGVIDGSLTVDNYQEINNESFFFYLGFSKTNLDFILKRRPKYFCLNSLDDPQSKLNFKHLVEQY